MPIIICRYGCYRPTRYGTPWVHPVNEDGRINFNATVGEYTGGFATGNAGNLIVNEPEEGQVYAYGQYDRFKGRTFYGYKQYINGIFTPVLRIGLRAAQLAVADAPKGETPC